MEHKDEIINDVKQMAVEKATSGFSLSEWLGIKEKVQEIAESLHQQALLTPDVSDDKIDYVQHLYSFVERAPITHFLPDFFKDFIIYVMALFGQATHFTINVIFKWIFESITTIVLYTPEFLFNSAWFSSSVGTFSILSVSLVTLMTIFQGIKRICKKDFTPLKHTLTRLPVAIGVSGLAPYLFSNGVKWLNKLTKFVCDLGTDQITSSKLVIDSSMSFLFEPVNILVMLLFLLFYVLEMIPMFYSHGKRWFKFLATAIMTPFAMCCYLFKDTEHYFNQWFTAIKNHGINQLGYATYISILGVLMFATPNPTTFGELITKLILMLGGLTLISSPPDVAGYFTGEKSNMIKDVKGKITDSIDKVKAGKNAMDTGLVGSAKIAGKVYRWMRR